MHPIAPGMRNEQCFYFYHGFVLYNRQNRQCNENITNCWVKRWWFYQPTGSQRGGFAGQKVKVSAIPRCLGAVVTND